MRSSAELVCLMSASNKAAIWPHVAPLLRAAIAKAGLGRFEDIERDIIEGAALIWIAWSDRIEAAASTALISTDAGLICLVTACGGADRARWLPLLAQIEEYARAEGCRAVRVVGRRGWSRVLDGYGLRAVVLQRDL